MADWWKGRATLLRFGYFELYVAELTECENKMCDPDEARCDFSNLFHSVRVPLSLLSVLADDTYIHSYSFLV